MFYALALVCDDYFVPSLEKICEVKYIYNDWLDYSFNLSVFYCHYLWSETVYSCQQSTVYTKSPEISGIFQLTVVQNSAYLTSSRTWYLTSYKDFNVIKLLCILTKCN